MLNDQPSRPPRRSANGSVLASALVPRVFGYLVTFFKQNRLLNGASESSFRNEFYFNVFGAFLIRLFFFWFCTHLSWSCWYSGRCINPIALALDGMNPSMSLSLYTLNQGLSAVQRIGNFRLQWRSRS
jgi:hypothetical protein